jgi:hypothetical protein
VAERTQQTERWTIRKAMPGNLGATWPYDSKQASIVGPDTEPVQVVPAQTAERLATAAEQILTTPRDERRLSHWTELQDAISAFRAGSSKEGQ